MSQFTAISTTQPGLPLRFFVSSPVTYLEVPSRHRIMDDAAFLHFYKLALLRFPPAASQTLPYLAIDDLDNHFVSLVTINLLAEEVGNHCVASFGGCLL